MRREEEEEKGARGEVGKAGEKAGSMPRAVRVGEAQGKPGEWRGSVGGVGKPVGRKGDLG